MNYTEHYHDWLRDAHAMEKQAESMLESMASRIENYPDIKARIEQHISETKHQITMPVYSHFSDYPVSANRYNADCRSGDYYGHCAGACASDVG